jgi:mRNA-decapping enzyme subunit 2
LCVRFIINLPPEELESVERICFQVEEAQWFYEDFIRPLDPSLPSLSLRAFSLRIFQHCPLFSEWSADNYTAAFAEFLAYKSRVPVRGAIMLNEEMDEVVLVKGWKKGANWSFPRGKINKDEDDLDCAVREVYEETGFDISAAGLVKEAKDMKYIEVTMREQHMRLYVFRGVPMDTYFEPRTRKEISKIQWYKLNDLPTLKKNKQQEGIGDSIANANKFYMVAPFLVPLKKWISQQRKRESRISSQAYGTIPVVTEEPFTDYEADIVNGVKHHDNIPSDLPEVSQSQNPQVDPSIHLKQLLNVRNPAVENEPLAMMPNVDAAKSSALLALLRKGSRPNVAEISKPNTPFDQMSFPPDVPRSPHHHHPRPLQFSALPPPPHFPISPYEANSDAGIHVLPVARQGETVMPLTPTFASSTESPARNTASHQGAAPYQRTGDPEFSHSHFEPSHGPRVPPASALPPLTNHARTLLDVFKRAQPTQEAVAALPVSTTHKPSSTISAANYGQRSHMTVPALTPTDPAPQVPTLLANRAKARNQDENNTKQAPVDHRTSLLGLFKLLPTPTAEMAPHGSTPKPPLAPVELAASSTSTMQKADPQQKQLLTRLLQQKSSFATKTGSQVSGGSRRGQTSATISGPLNQPQFEGIAKSSRQPSLPNGPARIPAPAHKTLFDPNQGVQKKILTRPVGADQSPARSPRPSRAGHAASPKRPTSHKNDETKPFQPQILRRPVTDSKDSPLQPNAQAISQSSTEAVKPPPATSQPPAIQSLPKQPRNQDKPQIESHRQTLLSLFSNPSPLSPTNQAHSSQPSGLPGRISTSPPASGSGIVSPLTEKHLSSRSRLGSLASVVSTGSQARPAGEKRQTTASDKAFLLGYLGRIASQES